MMFSRGFYHMTQYASEMFHYGAVWYGVGALLLLAAVVVAIVLIARRKKVMGHHHNEAAIDVLNMKFASGEITEEEYLKRKTVLRKG